MYMPKKYHCKTLSPTDAAYLAGIFDGEGSIGVSRYRNKENACGYKFEPYVNITNTSKAMLDWVCEKTGLDKVYDRKESSIKAKRRCWRWSARRLEVAPLLRQVIPYMVVKKDQALNVIAFMESRPKVANYGAFDYEGQVAFWIKSGELNARGELIDMNNPVVSQHQGLAKIHENHFLTFDQPASGT